MIIFIPDNTLIYEKNVYVSMNHFFDMVRSYSGSREIVIFLMGLVIDESKIKKAKF